MHKTLHLSLKDTMCQYRILSLLDSLCVCDKLVAFSAKHLGKKVKSVRVVA